MSAIDPMLDTAEAGRTRRAAVDMSMLAHDIRGALQGVVGGVAALEASRLPPDLAAQVDRIAAASRSLESLIGIAIEGASGEEAAGELDLDQFLAYVSDRWTGEAEGQGVTLAISRAEGTPDGLRLPHLPLARLLGNLVSNAIWHGGPGTVRISFGGTADSGLTVRVRDEGRGIDARVRAAFASDRDEDGSVHWLGLRIVRDLARQLGVEVALGDAPGGGAVATVRFPPDLCVETVPAAPPPPSGAASAALAGLRVLLAEDNATNQMVATQMLGALGIEVTVASDGAEALERFEAAEFDLLLVDIEMPRVSGLDVIRRIRARSDARAGVPLVALTAYALREHRQRIAEAGADGLISKPITGVEALAQGIAPHVRRAAPAGDTREPAVKQPQAAAGDEAGPVVDRATYDALRDTIGTEMMDDLLGKFVADLERARADLAGAIEPTDRQTMRSASHILISIAGAIGAVRLESCARRLNVAAPNADPADLGRDVQSCLAEIDAAVTFARGERAEV